MQSTFSPWPMSCSTRHRFCLRCRSNRVFEHVRGIDWRCRDCGAERSLTIDPVVESHRGGDFERFWSKVKVTPFCWNWMPKWSGRGPRFQLNGKDEKIARVAFYLYRGVWPTWRAVRTCGNILCAKPDHIIDLHPSRIMALMRRLGKTANIRRPQSARCKRGHKREGSNLLPGRSCRACWNASRRRTYAREKVLTR